jgi:uncharacterized protein YbjT (DUF2867 family)
MNQILVIGGTGNVGREVLSQLAAAGAPAKALVRNPNSARVPSQIEVVSGDLTLPDTLDEALRDISTVFLLWMAPGQTAVPVLERIAGRARRIVFLSAPLKTPHPLFQQPNPRRVLDETIERLIEDSGLEWTFVRPGMIAANAAVWWGPQIRAGNTVRWPYLSVPTAPIDPRDIAAVAVRALCEDGHAGANYVITGSQSLTHFEQLSIISDAIGRKLQIEEMSPDEARREWAATWPPFVIDMLLNAWAAAAGHPAFVSEGFAELMGRPPRTLRQWANDHVGDFKN